MSGLWNSLVRVQPCSEKIESDPNLIGKIFENHQSDPVLSANVKSCIYILPHEAKQLLELLPLPKYDWLKAKELHQCFCIMRQNRYSLLAFPKFNKEVSIRLQREKHCWSYFAIRQSDCLDWSSDNDGTLWLARSLLHMTKNPTRKPKT